MVIAMPELPEVEIVKRELEAKIVGKEINVVRFDTPKMMRPSPSGFVAGVTGKEIKAVRRRAKLLVFELSPLSYFVCHLKLTGRLFFRKPTEVQDNYVHIVFQFQDKTELRFSDSRKFGFCHYLQNEEEQLEILAGFGLEPLDDLTPDAFYRILSGTRRKTKVVLMDQKIISGIGNIYANEALWLANINPVRPANELSREEAGRLFLAIENVIKEALRHGGSSDQWYRHTDGSKGHYQERFKVYGRVGESCLKCGGEIERDKVGGRGTFWCPKCQKQ